MKRTPFKRHSRRNPYAKPERVTRQILEARAAEMRRKPTPAEAALWKKLRALKMGWRRQYVLGLYILDFFCPEYLAVIEVDGGGHAAPVQARKDRQRDGKLRRLGFIVQRIRNEDVAAYDAKSEWMVFSSGVSPINWEEVIADIGAEAARIMERAK